MKTAVLHVPHRDSELAMASMLKAIGYRALGLDSALSSKLHNAVKFNAVSCLQEKASLSELERCDIFVCVKHYHIDPMLKFAPYLQDKILWFDINGGIPLQFIEKQPYKTYPSCLPVPYVSANKRYAPGSYFNLTGCERYVCYVPFSRIDEYSAVNRNNFGQTPICLVHAPKHWGYGWSISTMQELGLKYYGKKAPDGPVPQGRVAGCLQSALCYVHMKDHDCPGFALYQALASRCPVVVTSIFLERTLYTDLYRDGETCLVLQDDGSLPKDERVKLLQSNACKILERLRDPVENRRIGCAGARRLNELLWRPSTNGSSFKQFIEANFK